MKQFITFLIALIALTVVTTGCSESQTPVEKLQAHAKATAQTITIEVRNADGEVIEHFKVTPDSIEGSFTKRTRGRTAAETAAKPDSAPKTTKRTIKPPTNEKEELALTDREMAMLFMQESLQHERMPVIPTVKVTAKPKADEPEGLEAFSAWLHRK